MKDTPTIQILDWAQPPPVKSRPRSKVLATISGAIAFFVSTGFALRKSMDFECKGNVSISKQIVEGVREDFRAFLELMGGGRDRNKGV